MRIGLASRTTANERERLRPAPTPQLAEDYVRALWWVLALASYRDSIDYRVLPALWRDEVLRDPGRLAAAAATQESGGWWRLSRTEPVPA